VAVIPANPKILNSRPYTGNSDGASAGPRAGTDEWIRQAIRYSNGAFFNNGSWGIRDKKGSPGSLSVHACGRAWDASYRKTEQHPTSNRKGAVAFLNIVIANANALGVECVLDYFPQKFGRGWQCTRQAWKSYSKPEIGGAPGGDWHHYEISPAMADSPALVKQAFQRVFGEIPQ